MDSKAPSLVDLHVGRRLRARRDELKLSQGDLAGQLGVTFQQVQKYENGRNRITAGRLYELAKALDIAIPYFFSGATEIDKAMAGLAEEGADYAAAEDADIVDLVSAFCAIEDASQRRSVLAMARKAAGRKSRGG